MLDDAPEDCVDFLVAETPQLRLSFPSPFLEDFLEDRALKREGHSGDEKLALLPFFLPSLVAANEAKVEQTGLLRELGLFKR